MVIAFLAASSAIDLQSRTAGEMGKTFERTAMFRGLAERTNCLTAAAVLMLAATGANANLVTNGGFETGDFTGWTQFGNTSFTQVSSVPDFVHSGTEGVAAGPPSTPGGIFQTLVTTPGDMYQIKFWLTNVIPAVIGASTNSFDFNWDGQASEVSFVDTSAFGFAGYSLNLVASTASTDLRFTFQHDAWFWGLDDVSVVAAAPEPGTLALLGLGLAGLAATRRRKQ